MVLWQEEVFFMFSILLSCWAHVLLDRQIVPAPQAPLCSGIPIILAASGKISGPSWQLVLGCDYRICSFDTEPSCDCILVIVGGWKRWKCLLNISTDVLEACRTSLGCVESRSHCQKEGLAPLFICRFARFACRSGSGHIKHVVLVIATHWLLAYKTETLSIFVKTVVLHHSHVYFNSEMFGHPSQILALVCMFVPAHEGYTQPTRNYQIEALISGDFSCNNMAVSSDGQRPQMLPGNRLLWLVVVGGGCLWLGCGWYI